MSKIKETITALTAGELPGAVHINRKEREPMTDERLGMILKCIERVALIVGVTVLILNAGTWKLVVVLGFAIFFFLIYFCAKD